MKTQYKFKCKYCTVETIEDKPFPITEGGYIDNSCSQYVKYIWCPNCKKKIIIEI